MNISNRFWIYLFCFYILSIQLNAQSVKSKPANSSANKTSVNFPNTAAGEKALLDEISRMEAASEEFVTYDDLETAERNARRSNNAKSLAEYKRLTELSENQKPTMEKVRNLRWNFVKRPVHFDNAKLANAYYLLLYDAPYAHDLTDEQLSEILKGLETHRRDLKFVVNSSIASTLVENRKYHPKSIFNNEAEKYARAVIPETEEKIKNLPEKEAVENADSMRAEALSSLGNILFKEGKLIEAEENLIKAESLLPVNTESLKIKRISMTNNMRLARLYTETKQFEKAENYYLKASQRFPNEWMNYEDLYKARNEGKNEGFEDYFKVINEKISLKLKQEIISKRIENPQDAAPFQLDTIKGAKISLNDLKGKIVIINLWGTWCAPCVRELPELQQLYNKYENDSEVAILTMDADDELETVKKFIADKKYEFPVLMGDSYKENLKFYGTITFPTTLFIGKTGKIDFIKIGNSPKLFEEFNWRIEALKEVR